MIIKIGVLINKVFIKKIITTSHTTMIRQRPTTKITTIKIDKAVSSSNLKPTINREAILIPTKRKLTILKVSLIKLRRKYLFHNLNKRIHLPYLISKPSQ